MVAWAIAFTTILFSLTAFAANFSRMAKALNLNQPHREHFDPTAVEKKAGFAVNEKDSDAFQHQD